ncbi:MAG TPA: DoxX family protein [bacterium]|nr:DoxX family protein [bacterium]
MDDYFKKAEGLLPLAGRIFLAALFLWSGYGKIGGWDNAAGYMAAMHMPLIPFFLGAALALELAGGLAVLFGFKTRLMAFLLALYLVPTTLIFHNFWSAPPDQHLMQLINFMKNGAIFGGLLMMARLGAGEFSIDNMLATRRTKSEEAAPSLKKAT